MTNASPRFLFLPRVRGGGIRAALALLFVAVVHVGAAQSAVLSDAQVLSILRQQGFASSTDAGTRLSYVGDIHTRRGTFSIYYYDHINVQDAHGLQKLVIIKDGRTYAGSYLLDVDDPIPRISKHDVVFAVPPTLGNVIHFDGGPPAQAWINGANSELER